jgi:hypothetical protein
MASDNNCGVACGRISNVTDKSETLKAVFRASHVHLGFASAYQEIAAMLDPDEMPICALNVRSLWIGGEPVKGRPPILLLTNENMVIEKIDPKGTFLRANVDFETVSLASITNVSPLEKGFFEVQLKDGRVVRVRRVGSWTGVKDSQKFHAALTDALTTS